MLIGKSYINVCPAQVFEMVRFYFEDALGLDTGDIKITAVEMCIDGSLLITTEGRKVNIDDSEEEDDLL